MMMMRRIGAKGSYSTTLETVDLRNQMRNTRYEPFDSVTSAEDVIPGNDPVGTRFICHNGNDVMQGSGYDGLLKRRWQMEWMEFSYGGMLSWEKSIK